MVSSILTDSIDAYTSLIIWLIELTSGYHVSKGRNILCRIIRRYEYLNETTAIEVQITANKERRGGDLQKDLSKCCPEKTRKNEVVPIPVCSSGGQRVLRC